MLSKYGLFGFPVEVSFSSVQFSLSFMFNSLHPHGLQHTRPPCPSPTPGVYPNSCPLSQWCHPTISSSVIPFSSHLQSFPASGSFQISQLFALGGQSIGVSASASVLPMNTQDWSLGWTVGSPCIQGNLKSLLQYYSSKAIILWRLHYIGIIDWIIRHWPLSRYPTSLPFLNQGSGTKVSNPYNHRFWAQEGPSGVPKHGNLSVSCFLTLALMTFFEFQRIDSSSC